MASDRTRFPIDTDINPGDRDFYIDTDRASNPNRPKTIPDQAPILPPGSGKSEPSEPKKK